MRPHRLLPLVLVLACVGHDEGTSASEGSASTTSTATGVDTSTTDLASTDGATSTSIGSAATTADASTAAATDGACDPDPPDQGMSCQRFCDRLVVCDLDGAFDGCPCEGFDRYGACCDQRWAEVAECFDGATCAEIEDEGPCWDVYVSAIELCLDGECAYGESPPGAVPCYSEVECGAELNERIECQGGTCVCTRDGVVVGMCAGECSGDWGAPILFEDCCR
ncbi:MAG: hypothetical protein R3B09_26615 [Nannocystaceae bacterium]